MIEDANTHILNMPLPYLHAVYITSGEAKSNSEERQNVIKILILLHTLSKILTFFMKTAFKLRINQNKKYKCTRVTII